jgi:ornithine cyclodeaminase/alanine dehydrogenase-like protein (mu-crystallin family)
MPILLSEKNLAPLLSDPANMDSLLVRIEESFRAFNSGDVAGQVRLETTLTDPKKRYRVTTSAVPGAGQGMRISALFRGAKDAYFIALFEEVSGNLQAILAGAALNVWRTGAPAGVASQYLAPAEADCLGLIGSGRQARGQLLAIRRALPSLREVRVFSPTRAHRESFAKSMSDWLSVDVNAVDSAQAAVENAPIVSLATSSRSTIVEPGWIRPGALIISITSGQLPVETVKNSRVIVSWKEEVLGGEAPRQPYAAMIADGSWSGVDIAAELGDVLLGKVVARRNASETIVFESVGMPLWDSTAAAWAYRWALEHNVGTPFSLE